MSEKPKNTSTPKRTSPAVIALTLTLLSIVALFLCMMTFSIVGESALSIAEMTATAEYVPAIAQP